jgi:hypothetical protein
MLPPPEHRPPLECDHCFGCGHICTRCNHPVNVCSCALDTEEISRCFRCDGTGVRVRATVRGYQQRGVGNA